MDNKPNVTYITIGGYVELNKYRYLYFVILFTAYILIPCSNSTVVYLICIHKNLHEPMYIFIAALLINSVLFSTAVYPKLLIDILSERQLISYAGCLFQWYFYYSLGASEFLLLAAMSYDRYVSICKPLQYPTIMSRNIVCILLALAWFLPAFQFAVQFMLNVNKKICNYTFKGIICNSTLYNLRCVIPSAQHIIGMVIFVNVLPLPVLFILFTYTRLFIIAYQSSKEVRRKAAQTCLPHLIVLISVSLVAAYDGLLLRMEIDYPQMVRFIMSLQTIIYHPLFNPLIYGLKMKEIYKHLKKLFVKMV